MPIYEYHCAACDHAFEEPRSMSEFREPMACPICTEPANRVIYSAPRLSTMRADRRQAHERNERSAHEPRMSRGHICGPGCGHRHGTGASAGGEKTAPPIKSQPGKRPWMLGH